MPRCFRGRHLPLRPARLETLTDINLVAAATCASPRPPVYGAV
ncbi:hypothetical protein ABI_18260 [Asticcacaulis biprosthecium C19]|uniref:Uncharacterized protein n=1 Tax=Asticcacaulis biprosthecium C19 TaxID=715226 RepID=F4QKT3_9CAUL|nr:hypothetical protein ABI_18260 [Asticcacaulis biprosthecium C19]